MPRYRFAVIILLILNGSPCLASGPTLAWDPVSPPPEGYRLFQRLAGTHYDYRRPVYQGPALEYTPTGLVPGKRYCWVVRAYDHGCESEDSNEVCFRPPAAGKVSGINLQRKDGKMYLVTSQMPKDQVDYYEVEIDDQVVRAEAEKAGGQARLHYELPESLASGKHTVRIRAINTWGKGPWSSPFEFTKVLPGPVSGIGLSVD